MIDSYSYSNLPRRILAHHANHFPSAIPQRYRNAGNLFRHFQSEVNRKTFPNGRFRLKVHSALGKIHGRHQFLRRRAFSEAHPQRDRHSEPLRFAPISFCHLEPLSRAEGCAQGLLSKGNQS